MTISLDSDLEQYILGKVRSGEYASPDDAIRQGLRLLREQDEKLSALRREIAIGIAEADRGELGPFDPLATLAAVRARHGQTPGAG